MTTTECTSCRGEGSIHATDYFRGRSYDIRIPCGACHQTGRIEVEYGEFGDKVGFDYCDCPRGRHAWKSDRVDYLRLSQEATDRGECPF